MNRILKRTLLVAGLGAALGFGATANANIIDLFSDPGALSGDRVVDEAGGVCGGGTTAGATWSATGCFFQYSGSNIIGGSRDLNVLIQGPSSDPRASLAAGAGLLSFSNNADTTSVGTVQWDGADNSPTLSHTFMDQNLINQEGCGTGGCVEFVASVIFADLGFNYSITVVDTSGNTSVLETASIAAVPPAENAVYLFEWFNRANGCYTDLGLFFCITKTGTVDFTHVGGLQLQIDYAGGITPQQASVDLQLASITKQGVPEPGTLALAGLALAGMAGLRRRKTA